MTHFRSSYSDERAANVSAYFDPKVKQAIIEVELEYLERLPRNGNALLDVGCGNGAFAIAASKSGWNVTAIDPALDESHFQSHAVRPIVGTPADLEPGAEFDVVTLWDVIEHVPDPEAFLNEILPRVRVGGRLVVETGNYMSADRVENGEKHWMFQLDHRWYFSPETLAKLLTRMGCAEPVLEPLVLRPNWTGHLAYAGPTVRRWVGHALRSPGKARDAVRIYKDLCAARMWQAPGLPIFCMSFTRRE